MALGTENLHIGHHQSYSAGQKQQRQRQLAPAPVRSMAPYSKPMSFSSGTTLDSDNPSVIRRNARERNRVKQVNNGFLNLRQHIPQAIVADLSNGRRGIGPGANKKLSKVDTLKMAVEYIRRLQRVIDEVDSGDDATSVSSFGSSNSSFACSSSTASMMNTSESPAPASPSGGFYGQQFMPMGYTSGSFQLHQQQQQQQLFTSYPMQQQQQTLISPTGSTTSSGCSSDSPLYHQPTSAAQFQMKFEDSFDEYQQQQHHHHHQQQQQQQYHQQDQQHLEQFNDSGSVVEDEELLDYISLWQEDA